MAEQCGARAETSNVAHATHVCGVTESAHHAGHRWHKCRICGAPFESTVDPADVPRGPSRGIVRVDQAMPRRLVHVRVSEAGNVRLAAVFVRAHPGIEWSHVHVAGTLRGSASTVADRLAEMAADLLDAAAEVDPARHCPACAMHLGRLCDAHQVTPGGNADETPGTVIGTSDSEATTWTEIGGGSSFGRRRLDPPLRVPAGGYLRLHRDHALAYDQYGQEVGAAHVIDSRRAEGADPDVMAIQSFDAAERSAEVTP